MLSFTDLVITMETVMHGEAIEDSVRMTRCRAADDLARVGEAMLAARHADFLVAQVVTEARRAGRSWAEIAAAGQISAQCARQRWEQSS